MSKGKQKNQRPSPPARPAVTAPSATTFRPVANTPATPTLAGPAQHAVEIAELHEKALNGAKDVDTERALDEAPKPGDAPIDLAAEAARAREAVAICTSRAERAQVAEDEALRKQRSLDEKTALVAERESRLREEEAKLREGQSGVEKALADIKSKHTEISTRQAQVLADEQRLRTRELNAEAGFAAERRESLRMLDTEAGTVRKAMTQSRDAIAQERSEWEERRRAEKKALDAELEAFRVKGRQELDAGREALSQEMQTESAKLAQKSAELKKEGARQAVERQVLDEDRAAFNERVERRAIAVLEQARAKQAELEAQLEAARADRERLFETLRLKEAAERVLGNRPLEEVHEEMESLRRERESLKAEIAKRPDADATRRLEELEQAQEDREIEHGRLLMETQQLKQIVARSSIAVTEMETLRDQKAALESSVDTLRATLDELRKDVDERIRTSAAKSPFPACTLMDESLSLQAKVPLFEGPLNLASFCEDLRQRIAWSPKREERLFYGPEHIRCFVAGLAMSRLHLLQGISGTGKTSLPRAFARAIYAESTLVEVQAGWRDRADLLGHFNTFESKFHESEFLQALYRAQRPRHANRPFFVVLDEMNLSHPEQYFADLLSTLEQKPEEQAIALMPVGVKSAPVGLKEGRILPIPQNVWFVGTANHDETTKDFADKTYDRAHVMELPRHRTEFAPTPPEERDPVALDALLGAFDAAKTKHAKEAKRAYDFLDTTFAKLLGERFRVGWGNRLERQMASFVPVVMASGGDVGEAVDHILATKLLRKIRDRHDTRMGDIEALKKRLEQEWPTLTTTHGADQSSQILRDEVRRLGGGSGDEEGG